MKSTRAPAEFKSEPHPESWFYERIKERFEAKEIGTFAPMYNFYKHLKLHPIAFTLFTYLQTHMTFADAAAPFRVSIATLSEEANLSYRTAVKYLDVLVDRGLLVISPQHGRTEFELRWERIYNECVEGERRRWGTAEIKYITDPLRRKEVEAYAEEPPEDYVPVPPRKVSGWKYS